MEFRPSISISRELFAALLLSIAAFPCVAHSNPRPFSETKKVVLQLKWQHQFQFAGYYAALKNGYYTDEGLSVEVVQGGPDIASMERVLNGDAHFGVASSELVLARMQGHPTVACATIFQHSAYVLLTKNESGIRNPSDLAGKRIHTSAAGGDAQFRAMLLREGVSLERLEFLSGPWQLEDLVSGKADVISGYTTTQAPYLRSKGLKIFEIDPMDYGIDFYGDTLFTTDRFLQRNRGTVEAMTRASIRGWEYAMENPEEMVDFILELPGVKERGTNRSHLLEEAAKMRMLIVPDVVDIGHMNPGRWEKVAEIYEEAGIATIPAEQDWLHDFVFRPKEETQATSLVFITTLIGMAGLFVLGWSLLLRRESNDRKAQIREQARLNQLILDTAMDAVICVDPDGRISHWNGQSSKMFGLGSHQAGGKSVEEFLPGLLSRSNDEIENSRFEMDACRSSGEHFPAELSLSTVTESAAVWLNIFVRDITERRGLEETLRQSQKMQAIGQLAGGVAHDFNNLLTVIQGNAVLSTSDASDANHERLAEIIEASERASGLTNQLLAFSRQQPMKIKSVDLNKSVAGVGKMLKRLIGEDIELEFDLAEEPTRVSADPGMLEQVILNLAVNARDAMPNGGKLTIGTTVATVREGDAVLSENREPGDYVRLNVRDTGTGIAQKDMPRIFDPFFTTKEVGRGTGLGLATVFGIVEQHSGWMTVESAMGEGTEFFVWIPANHVFGDPHLPESCPIQCKRGEAASSGHETILLVEDEAMVRTIARKLLQMNGYEVIEAENGRVAMETWAAHREEIDLLLTDVVMPEGMTGHDLATCLQAERPDLRVVYTSGYSAEVFRGEAVFPEDAIFLGKPYLPEELLNKVREALNSLALPA